MAYLFTGSLVRSETGTKVMTRIVMGRYHDSSGTFRLERAADATSYTCRHVSLVEYIWSFDWIVAVLL